MRRGRKRYKERRESERGGERNEKERERENGEPICVRIAIRWMERRWVKLKEN